MAIVECYSEKQGGLLGSSEWPLMVSQCDDGTLGLTDFLVLHTTIYDSVCICIHQHVGHQTQWENPYTKLL